MKKSANLEISNVANERVETVYVGTAKSRQLN